MDGWIDRFIVINEYKIHVLRILQSSISIVFNIHIFMLSIEMHNLHIMVSQ